MTRPIEPISGAVDRILNRIVVVSVMLAAWAIIYCIGVRVWEAFQ